VAVLLGAVVIACQPSGTSRSGASASDSPPQRIVSLAPAITELLFAIGAGERLVGRTAWGRYPPEAARVPSVGDGLDPNIEAIVARRPDLVVSYASSTNAPAMERLRALDIATVSVRLDRLSDLGRAARLLGGLIGDSARADSLVVELEQRLARTAAPAADAPTVLIVAWDNPPIVIGSTSVLSEIVELAGGRNAFDDIERPSAEVSLETIAARDPDLVLLAGETEAPALVERPEWRVVRAVRERRFVRVQGSEFAWPSFRAPQAIRKLRAAMERAGW
jgi:iron complex transport system substrate-binding protein